MLDDCGVGFSNHQSVPINDEIKKVIQPMHLKYTLSESSFFIGDDSLFDTQCFYLLQSFHHIGIRLAALTYSVMVMTCETSHDLI